MIDSHCHLTADDFSSDRVAVIERATTAGLSHLVTICDEMSDIEKCSELAKKYDHIFYTVGVHPHHAKLFDLEKDIDRLKTAARGEKCRGIGEIGLDYYYMNSPKDTQQRVFEAQLKLAKELSLPAVVHCRDAVEDVWTIVNHVKPKSLVIHCCTEKWADVKKFVDAGYHLSFTGIVTYPKSDDIRVTVKECPLTNLMVETDAPYLAPVPHRGKRCEPMHVMETAKKIAEVKGLPIEEVDRVTSQVTKAFFNL